MSKLMFKPLSDWEVSSVEFEIKRVKKKMEMAKITITNCKRWLVACEKELEQKKVRE